MLPYEGRAIAFAPVACPDEATVRCRTTGGSLNGTRGNWHQNRPIWTNDWAQGAERKRHKGASGRRSPCWLASSHAAHGHRDEPGEARGRLRHYLPADSKV